MSFAERKKLYLIFGIIPGAILLLISLLGFVYTLFGGISDLVKGEYKNIYGYLLFFTICAVMIYSYICGYMVVFKKHQITKKGFVVTGLIFGILVCAAYSFVLSDTTLFQLCFLFPTIVGVCLVLELYPIFGNKKCT